MGASPLVHLPMRQPQKFGGRSAHQHPDEKAERVVDSEKNPEGVACAGIKTCRKQRDSSQQPNFEEMCPDE